MLLLLLMQVLNHRLSKFPSRSDMHYFKSRFHWSYCHVPKEVERQDSNMCLEDRNVGQAPSITIVDPES